MTARLGLRWAGLAALLAAAGCSSPSPANIQLRKDNQALTSQVQDLQRQNAGLTAQIAAAQSGNSIPTLPESRLDQLFTVHGLTLGELTGGYTPLLTGPDQMLKVYAVPTDDDGQPLKAAGSFVVDLRDITAADGPLIGHWEFPLDQARTLWFGRAMLYTYVLDCPWQTIPQHAGLLVNVTFTDALTGRRFTAHQNITVNLPTTQPAS